MSESADTVVPPAKSPAKQRRLAWVLVIAAVLAGSSIAAWVLLSGLGGPAGPSVTLGTPYTWGGGHVVNVTHVDRADPLPEYSASLDSGTVNEGRLSPLVNGSANGSLIFLDQDEDNRLSAGDVFVIGPLPAGNHTLTLRWRQTLVASRTIGGTVVQPPTVLFGQATAVVNGFDFAVAGVTRAEPAARYRVVLQVNLTTGPPVALSASVSVTVGGDTYTITWTDVGGEGDVTGGDQFRVTKAGGLPAGSTFTFFILWESGAAVGTQTFGT